MNSFFVAIPTVIGYFLAISIGVICLVFMIGTRKPWRFLLITLGIVLVAAAAWAAAYFYFYAGSR